MPRTVWEHIQRMIEERVQENLTYEERRIKQGYTVGHGGK